MRPWLFLEYLVEILGGEFPHIKPIFGVTSADVAILRPNGWLKVAFWQLGSMSPKKSSGRKLGGSVSPPCKKTKAAWPLSSLMMCADVCLSVGCVLWPRTPKEGSAWDPLLQIVPRKKLVTSASSLREHFGRFWHFLCIEYQVESQSVSFVEKH